MTDKPEKPQNNDIDNQIPENDEQKPNLNTSDVDVEGALAALASLEELTREPEPDEDVLESETFELEPEFDEDDSDEDIIEIQEFERVEEPDDYELDSISETQIPLDISDDNDIESIHTETQYETSFPHPPLSVLHRGQLASVIPALLLMGIGAYLTFVLTTSELNLSPLLIGSIGLSVLGIIFIGQWLSSARWTIGNFFLGLSFLLLGLSSAYLTLPTNLAWFDGYPLLSVAIGTAFVITDIVVPSGRRIWLIGLILAIIGLLGLAVTTVLFDTIMPFSGILLPVAGVIVLFLLIAPLFTGRQQETYENSD